MTTRLFTIKEQDLKLGGVELHFQAGAKCCSLRVRVTGGESLRGDTYFVTFANEGEVVRVQKIKPLEEGNSVA
jgi:hypothetical protein